MDELNVSSTSNQNPSAIDSVNVTSQYSKISDSVRRYTPPQMQCAVFCGGKKCKYESSKNWSSEDCALDGIYSHWITEDILAMSRPNKLQIEEFELIKQFNRAGIKSVVNLEVPGEHASCSMCPLSSSGFSYDPTFFMENEIYFYNYAWRDYGEASLAYLLDMVKVVSFSTTQGKVAIHCHAGLGRTGVLIACYLVYSMRLRANDAMRLVRNKRPGSIQSRLHILTVQQFEQFILPNCIIFCNRDLLKDKKIQEFTLQQYLKRQRFILHGLESKTLKYIPKILNVICERLLVLCGKASVLPVQISYDEENRLSFDDQYDMLQSAETSISEDKGDISSPSPVSQPPSSSTSIRTDDISMEPTYTNEEVVKSMLSDHVNMSEGLARFVRQYRLELNHKGMGAWTRLSNEKNLYVLTALFYLWLEHLRVPLLGNEELTSIVLYTNNIEETLKKFPYEVVATTNYILQFLVHLEVPEQYSERILRRLSASLTHRGVGSKGDAIVYRGFHEQGAEKGKPRKLNEGTLMKLMLVLQTILELYKQGKTLPMPKRNILEPETP